MRSTFFLAFLALAPVCRAQNTVTGSGFFFSSDGYLLTNLHVVTGCQTAGVNIRGLAVSAQVLSSDAKNDLALLKTERSPAFLQFRDDQRLKLGESIVAVGYPLAGVIASSMNLTTGTISALAGIGDDTRMIQFTAPVQPGNSGGPLLDQSGHVVGVVTGKLSPLLPGLIAFAAPRVARNSETSDPPKRPLDVTLLKGAQMRTILPATLLAIAIGFGSVQAQEVVVRVRPPREVVETRVAAPGPGYVWIGGYHQWNGNAYVWAPGRWEQPPRPHAVWVRHRWVHRHGGYVLVEGHWR
jgi:S1-C subfamily serine protease